MFENIFSIHKPYEPSGDQPEAIRLLTEGVEKGVRHQTLFGATGTGKTFTLANVIQNTGKPTLVIAHNKTLAAQLAAEFKEFFPENEVHYFVSYYDYYQPEAYMPITDTYIEKEAQINEEIDKLRHATTQVLLTKKDVIVVASVSAIYGLGNPKEYADVIMEIKVGLQTKRAEMIRSLVGMYFARVAGDPTPGTFRAIGNTIEIMPSNDDYVIRVHFADEKVSKIEILDAITRTIKGEEQSVMLFPAKHFITPEHIKNDAVHDIEEELAKQLNVLRKSGKELEAQRLSRRTRQDLALIKEVGYCNGIENYSRHFDRRKEGEAPHTLLSYFPHKKDGTPDFLTIIDESHVTLPQIGAMYAGDRARKETLIENGFRLPSAKDNRPLTFDEFENKVGPAIYLSATPGVYEFEHSNAKQCERHRVYMGKTNDIDATAERDIDITHTEKCHIVEQIIRPTGLVDPEIEILPVVEKGSYNGQVNDFIEKAEEITKKGARTLVTVLTKKMAEDLNDFLKERGIKSNYIHSDVKTIERIKILSEFREGVFDVLVGVNLLREGLDLPEVELVAILDADKEGFLRSTTSLVQTIGRAARNINGKVILYADTMTGSMERAVKETNRRRAIQLAYNKKHNITPVSVRKNIKDISDQFRKQHSRAVEELVHIDTKMATTARERKKLVKAKQKEMLEAAKNLDFETAALLRDEIKVLEDM